MVQPAQLRPEALAKLTTELGQQAGVDIASLDLDWVRRLHAILEFARAAPWRFWPGCSASPC